MDSEFVNHVVHWIKIDDRIKQITVESRMLKQEKKELEEKILSTMKDTNEDIVNMSSGGTIRRSVSKTKSGLKADYIQEILSKFTNDKEEAFIITESLLQNRPIKEREYLKRLKPRTKE